ncbi:MAG: ROK family protein, partial [Anaerolineae bacterium]|nr:ROK family protein [Anaerolineae bacterium]
MNDAFKLMQPSIAPALDPGFRPPVLANRAFRQAVTESGGGEPLVIGVERTNGSLSRFETTIFADGHPSAEANLSYVERIVKFLLWQRGGWKVYIGGSPRVGAYIAQTYAADGARAFDYRFMGEQVYQQPFTVVACRAGEVP